MKKTISIIIIATLFSCQEKRGNIPAQTHEEFVKKYSEIWKKQLVTNGEIGKPCGANTEEWIAKNPEAYFGLPKQIQAKSFDINGDHINDLLLYFTAGEPCTGGHETGSDFVKLLYSDGDYLLENNTLRHKIEQKISFEFQNKNNIVVKKVVFTINNFSKKIEGNYDLWTANDPDCCSSNQGTFSYQLFTFKMIISNK